MRSSRFPLLLPRWLAAAAVLVVPATGSAQPGASETDALALDQKILATAKKDSEIMANLTHLSDVIGARLTGSASLKKANDWTVGKMKEYGLTDVHLEAWEIPTGWERGTATARIIVPDNGRSLTIAARAWTPGTKGKIEGDVIVMTAKNSKDLAAFKGKLKNAIVLPRPPSEVRPITDLSFSPRPKDKKDAPGTDPKKTENPKPKTDAIRPNFQEMIAFRRELMDFLQTEGAAVLLEDAAKPHGLLNMTGSWRGKDRVNSAEPLASAFITHEHYALLYRLATRPGNPKTRVEIEINNTIIPGPIAVWNTVGEIKGNEKPDEFVVIGAHLDSWDLAQGTTDNGTGTTVVLEAARILTRSGVKPKRTIRFVLFTGEEQGLFGSKAYVQKHKDELPRTSMCLVHDTGTGKALGMGLQGREVLKPIMDRELASLKELGFKDISLRGMGGTDHLSFEAAGVPGFAVQQDMSEYRFTHHSQSDTLDKANEANLVQGAQVMAVTALRVANLPQLLPREKPEKKKVQPEKKKVQPEKKKVQPEKKP